MLRHTFSTLASGSKAFRTPCQIPARPGTHISHRTILPTITHRSLSWTKGQPNEKTRKANEKVLEHLDKKLEDTISVIGLKLWFLKDYSEFKGTEELLRHTGCHKQTVAECQALRQYYAKCLEDMAEMRQRVRTLAVINYEEQHPPPPKTIETALLLPDKEVSSCKQCNWSDGYC